MKFFIKFILVFVTFSFGFIKCSNKQANIRGLPIAIIFGKNISLESKELLSAGIESINSKFARIPWNVQNNTIDENSSHQILQTICQQMSRGVLAIFGPISLYSIDIIRSLTDSYDIPFLTWSDYFKPKSDISNKLQKKIRKKRNSVFQFEAITERKTNNFINYVENGHSFSRFKRQNEYIESDEYSTSNNNHQKISYINQTNFENKIKMNQLFFKPELAPALIEIIKFYEWSTFFYIYNHNNALKNLDALLEFQTNNENLIEKILIRKVINIHDCRDMLRAIEASMINMEKSSRHDKNNSYYKNKINIIVDIDSKENYMIFLNQVKDLGMTKIQYHYVLTTLGIYELDLNGFQHGGVRITGFSIVDYYNINTIKKISDLIQSKEPLNKIANIPHEAALFIDSLAFFNKKIQPIIGANMSSLFGMENVSLRRAEIYINKKKGINCSFNLFKMNKWPLGDIILEKLKSNVDSSDIFEGLTGLINFDSSGRRKNYTIGIFKVEMNVPLSKIGYFSNELGLKLNEERISESNKETQENNGQRKKIVVSIRDEPFLMFRPNEPGKNFTGNDRFIGYCVDLTKRIAEMVNFTYEIRLVKDNKFGNRDANGSWDGMVGELVRNEADLAVAPLTISSQRERAIEFSMPFMNMGISIMIKKPKKEKPGIFSFMAPLDASIWICVIFAYIGVSVVLFLVCRFSPYEWHADPKDNSKILKNDFSILNTLWFNLAALMQQGVDVAPRSASGRLVASAWWFFTLILISSYTANLAAFLTVERMVSPIESAEDLVKQTEIQYGAVEGGSTKEFFRNSKVPTYQRMWNFMNSWGPSVFVKHNFEGVQKVRDSNGKYAFLLESSVNEYLNERSECDTMKVGNDLDSKGYGIATPIRSDLRDSINLAVIQLREEGFLDELKTRWWYDRSECGNGANSAPSKDSAKNPLNLINVAGVFYTLIIGLVMSVMTAGLELMYKAKLQSKKNNMLFKDAVKSKMRLSISGYEDSIHDFQSSLKMKNGSDEVNQKSPFLK